MSFILTSSYKKRTRQRMQAVQLIDTSWGGISPFLQDIKRYQCYLGLWAYNNKRRDLPKY